MRAASYSACGAEPSRAARSRRARSARDAGAPAAHAGDGWRDQGGKGVSERRCAPREAQQLTLRWASAARCHAWSVGDGSAVCARCRVCPRLCACPCGGWAFELGVVRLVPCRVCEPLERRGAEAGGRPRPALRDESTERTKNTVRYATAERGGRAHLGALGAPAPTMAPPIHALRSCLHSAISQVRSCTTASAHDAAHHSARCAYPCLPWPQAPFGPAPDAVQPPFSASQLSSYLTMPSAELVPTKKIERLCIDSLRDLEARTRQGIARRLAALAAC